MRVNADVNVDLTVDYKKFDRDFDAETAEENRISTFEVIENENNDILILKMIEDDKVFSLSVIEELSEIIEEIAALDIDINNIDISFETLVMRYSFSVSSITNINIIKRRYRLLKN